MARMFHTFLKRRHVFKKHPPNQPPRRAIDSSGYRLAIYIFASNNLFRTTNWNPVNQI